MRHWLRIIRLALGLAGAGTALVGHAQAPAATSFAYSPAAPVKGTLKGVVELGAEGFNSLIVRVDARHRWKLERAEYGKSLISHNMAADVDIVRGVKVYFDKMLTYGVPQDARYVVISSGAAQAQVTAHLVAALKAAGYPATVVSAEREGAYGVAAVLPAPYAANSFVVDMGSGNTKISWLAQGQPTTLLTYGARFFEDIHTKPAAVLADVKAKAQRVPASLRQRCFILGGVPYELAKLAGAGTGRYTVLAAPASYAQRDEAKVKAGVAIYRTIAEATGCQEFVFDNQANFAIGYLLTTP